MKKYILYLLIIFSCFIIFIYHVSAAGTTTDKYPNNGLTTEEMNKHIEASQAEDSSSSTSDDDTPTSPLYESCPIFVDANDGQPTDLYNTLQELFTMIKIATPALVIILSTIDYLGAIAKSDDSEIKKATNRTIRRVIIGLLIFFLPFLLDIIFDVFDLTDVSRCQIGT